MTSPASSARYGAIIIGGTGAVGGSVVRALLDSPRCDRVLMISRRPVNAFDGHSNASKLQIAVIDYANIERETAARAPGYEVAFCTVGIGQPRKVTADEFRRVDVEYAAAFARAVAAAGGRSISLLSSVGADATSSNRYIRTKGDAEQAVISAGVPRTSIFRPSLLATDEIRYGLQDRVTQAVFPLLSPILPKRFHEIHVSDLGKAMQLNAEREGRMGVEFLYYPDFVGLLTAGSRG